MNCWKTLLAGCLILGLAACGAEPEEPLEQTGGGFVEEGGNVIPGDENDRDYCAEFGWYSDGRCDDFCVHPDPDCGGPGSDPDPAEPSPAPGPSEPDPGEPTEPDPGPEPGPDPGEPTPVEPEPVPSKCLDDDHPSVMRVGNVEECTLIDFACPSQYEYFYDDCGCGCVEVQACGSDADCPGGFCEQTVVCESEECPPELPAQCTYLDCDEPGEILCDALPPTCGTGLVAAARNGCWECVDARTCEPVYLP